MGATYWVYAGGVWRPLDESSGRVRGWAGRAAFCVARRGRLQLLRPGAVLRGLRALQRRRPTTVRDGMPLSRRRPASRRPRSPTRCCCAHAPPAAAPLAVAPPAAAPPQHARDAIEQPNLTTQCNSQTTLQSTSVAQAEKVDAAVQASAGCPTTDAPAPSRSDSDTEPPACKELIVKEEDVMALRSFLERNPRNLFQVDLLRFDEDDEYKSALFYSINPLVTVERSERVAQMLRQQRESQSLLREFASSLGLRAVGSQPARRHRYRTRRPRSSDKENRGDNRTASSARAHKSDNRSPNKLADPPSDSSSDTSSGSDSSDVFQTRTRTLRNKRLTHERNTRSKLAELSSIRSNAMSKQQRDDDARSKYLVGKLKSKDTEGLVNGVSDSNDSHGKDKGDEERPKEGKRNRADTRKDKISKAKERNDDSQSESNYGSKDREIMNLWKEGRSRSQDTKRRKSLRSRNDGQTRHSPTKRDGRSEDVVRNNIKTSRGREDRSDIAQRGDSSAESDASGIQNSKSRSRDTPSENRKKRQRNAEKYVISPSILGSKTRTHNENTSQEGGTGTKNRKKRSRDWHGRYTGNIQSKNSESSKIDAPKFSKDRDSSSIDRENIERTKTVDKTRDKTAKEPGSSSRSPTKRTESKKEGSKENPKRGENTEDSSGSGRRVWAERNGEASKGESDGQKTEGETSNSRPRRSTANVQSAEPQRREYSSLEDHAIVQWLSLGSRARRVNGNVVWQELQEQFRRIAGRSRSWHSLRNRYLRSILPALGALALPPATVAALRAAQATGELKSRRRGPRPSPLLALPAARSAWGARRTHATSESEAGPRSLRSSTQRPASPQKPPPRPASPPRQSPRTQSPHKSSRAANKSSRENQASPTYSEVTRRFAARHSVSTPELRPRGDGSPPRKTRKLYNPSAAL